MPVIPTYPGVCLEELPSGGRTIAGVPTSITLFIGRARQGPMNDPVLCLNWSDFERSFSSDYADCDLIQAVLLFFQNGGTQCYVTRIAHLGDSGSTGSASEAKAYDDVSAPQLGDYRMALDAIDRDVDLFNLMVLPGDSANGDSVPPGLWGEASAFCRKRRAFLLMDPPPAWLKATDAATDVDGLRLGLVKDHSAIFFPRVTITEDGLNRQVGPSGAMAGLMARIDGARGVWKAPAGIEADIRGVVGLEYRLSDEESGVLNPKAGNTLRIFPEGIVIWDARTMDGDDEFGSEYKYIPVRRTALFIEESLYRGLEWVVFEPNDEPLWAQIRLNVGAFMNNLFRQGAFQWQTPKDAYFVKCDKETMAQNDINKGIVNILVGFAPLRPAEFVIIKIQQMAGQLQT